MSEDKPIPGEPRVIILRDRKPEDQPIRRGDVVQWLHQYNGATIAHTGTVTSDFNGYICVGYSPVDKELKLVRIGRARYYPDGTPVEV